MSDSGGPIRLDLNNPEFQHQLFAAEKDQQRAVLTSLRKLAAMSWNQLYADRGLRWEAIRSQRGPHGAALYSLRLGRGFRAVAVRDGDWLRFLTLHPDHDSAYHR